MIRCLHCGELPCHCQCFERVALDNGIIAKLDAGIALRVIRDEKDPLKRLVLVMEVGEDATTDQLRSAVPQALRWRDGLVRYQGPSPDFRKVVIPRFLVSLKAACIPYRAMARAINDTIEAMVWLVVANPKLEHRVLQGRGLHPDPETLQDIIAIDTSLQGHAPSDAERLLIEVCVSNAHAWLGPFGFSESETKKLFSEAVKRARDGETPFLPGLPLNRDLVIRRIRTWQSSERLQDPTRTKFPPDDSNQ